MSIYRKQKRTKVNYRKIYQDNFGPIPKDEYGRTFEIHHIDGDNWNNTPSNLKALSIKEHYELHKSQGDHAEAWAIGCRMKISPDELSNLAHLSNIKTMNSGVNPFSNPAIRMKGTIAAREVHLEKIKNNEFHLQSGVIQSKASQERVSNGTHNMLGSSMNESMIKNGSHPSKIIVTCPHCNKSGGKPGMMTRHFDKCRLR
jgi:hypothetical protein